MKKSAFTLIELLVVIVIVGILATVSVAQFNDYQERARLAKAQAFAKQAETLLKAKTTSESLLPLLDLKFDQPNDASDLGGMNNDGTVTNAVWQSGDDCMNGGCFYFNGTDASISFSQPSNWQNQGSFTLSVWFKTSSTNDGHIFRQAGDWNKLISLRANAQSIRSELGFHVGGGNYSIYSDSTYKDRWQHVLITYNKDTTLFDFYVDGKLAKSQAINPPITEILSANMYIGSVNNSQAFFHGSIDDIALYPVALEF